MIKKVKTRSYLENLAHFKTKAGVHGKTKYTRKTKHKVKPIIVK
jgi:hypothetical protein